MTLIEPVSNFLQNMEAMNSMCQIVERMDIGTILSASQALGACQLGERSFTTHACQAFLKNDFISAKYSRIVLGVVASKLFHVIEKIKIDVRSSVCFFSLMKESRLKIRSFCFQVNRQVHRYALCKGHFIDLRKRIQKQKGREQYFKNRQVLGDSQHARGSKYLDAGPLKSKVINCKVVRLLK